MGTWPQEAAENSPKRGIGSTDCWIGAGSGPGPLRHRGELWEFPSFQFLTLAVSVPLKVTTASSHPTAASAGFSFGVDSFLLFPSLDSPVGLIPASQDANICKLGFNNLISDLEEPISFCLILGPEKTGKFTGPIEPEGV